MKKKLLVGLIGCMLVFSLTGCNTINTSNDITDTTTSNDAMEYVGNINNEIEEYRDSETGVHYFIFRAYYKAGMCPRYNADGTLYVD